MKISEVIFELIQLQIEWGDLEVVINENPLKDNFVNIGHFYFSCEEEGPKEGMTRIVIEGVR